MSSIGSLPSKEGASLAAKERRWRAGIEVLALVGPAGILTGVLYYFGYVSTKAFYAYFGIGLSTLNLSPTSYLIRTADTLFRPVATLLIVAVATFIAHLLLGQVLIRAEPRIARRVTLCFCGAGVALAGLGLFGLYGQWLGLVSPLSLAVSGLLLEYSFLLAARYTAPPPRMAVLLDVGVGLRRGLVATLVMTAIFWAVTNIAQDRGTASAELVELSLVLQPQAVVYSAQDLHLPGPGVRVTILDSKESAYRFRYNGLRPLLYANGRWFLLPVGWRHENGSTVIVLQDDPGRVRVDLAP